MTKVHFSSWADSYTNVEKLTPVQLSSMHGRLKGIAGAAFMGMGADDLACMEAQEKRYSLRAPATHSVAANSGQPVWQRLISMIKPIPGYRLNA